MGLFTKRRDIYLRTVRRKDQNNEQNQYWNVHYKGDKNMKWLITLLLILAVQYVTIDKDFLVIMQGLWIMKWWILPIALLFTLGVLYEAIDTKWNGRFVK